jgi:predicted RNase H-like nuclease (RuvC/YqgF family)
LQTTSTNENLSLQQLEIQCNNYTQMIEKLNIEIDVLKSEILGKNDEISSIQNEYSQLGITYQAKLAEMEQNSQMSVEENILQFQSEINRLNQVLIEKENFIQEAQSVIQQHLNRANVSTKIGDGHKLR